MSMAACSETNNRNTATAVKAEKEQLSYGSDICEFTGKTIREVRYGGRMVTSSGDTLNFMSAECLAGYLLKMESRDDVASLKVVDFVDGKKLMPVEELKFLNSKLRPSPNGMYLTAVDASNTKMVEFVYDAYPGPYLEWNEVVDKVEAEWFGETGNAAMN